MGQLQQDSSAVLRFEVEGDALLAGVQVREEQALLRVGLVVVERGHPASRVPREGPLDLDDVGAEVREKLGAVGPRDVVREVQDFDAVEG